MTCNLQWPEIKNTLLPGLAVTDRSDLAIHVFRMKLRVLMALVVDEKLFKKWRHMSESLSSRNVFYHMYTVFFMSPQSKTALLLSSFIDSIIFAKIPPNTSSSLRQVVLKNDMNTFCEAFNFSAVCMDDGNCTKLFTKQFIKKTGQSVVQLYITYRRRAP